MANGNPLCQLEQLGQSIWLDTLSRDLIQSGKLKQLAEEDGLKGVTSNPSIFEKAIAESDRYAADIETLAQQGKDVAGIYTELTVADIRAAADILRPTWERLHHADGYVSLEVNPHLAYETEATIDEARHLWELVDRPNIFIKIPATEPGLEAIRRSVAHGINVNVTLLFGLERYVKVAEAYMAGLQDRASAGKHVDDIWSVASFFLSRIDVLLDPRFDEIAAKDPEHREEAKRMRGQVAIASAREAYRIWQELFAPGRFGALRSCGAHTQRLLWASTGTKDPAYSDVKYVEALVAPETVNTLPLETIEAYRDHGEPRVSIVDEPEWTREVLARLPVLGIFLHEATEQLEREGVEKFNQAYDKLMQSLAHQRSAAAATPAH